jgi:hypothetical protein
VEAIFFLIPIIFIVLGILFIIVVIAQDDGGFIDLTFIDFGGGKKKKDKQR